LVEKQPIINSTFPLAVKKNVTYKQPIKSFFSSISSTNQQTRHWALEVTQKGKSTKRKESLKPGQKVRTIFKLTLQFFNFSSEVWEETLTTKNNFKYRTMGWRCTSAMQTQSVVTEPKLQDSSCCPNSRP
jgi:hypothetical protein